jgi:hypothetical protein
MPKMSKMPKVVEFYLLNIKRRSEATSTNIQLTIFNIQFFLAIRIRLRRGAWRHHLALRIR